MSEHLKKITARAKKIRKAHPAMKWTNAIKQASKEIKPARSAKKAKPAATRTRRKSLKENSAPGTKTKRTGENIAHNILRIAIYHFKHPLNGEHYLDLGDKRIYLNSEEFAILKEHLRK